MIVCSTVGNAHGHMVIHYLLSHTITTVQQIHVEHCLWKRTHLICLNILAKFVAPITKNFMPRSPETYQKSIDLIIYNLAICMCGSIQRLRLAYQSAAGGGYRVPNRCLRSPCRGSTTLQKCFKMFQRVISVISGSLCEERFIKRV